MELNNNQTYQYDNIKSKSRKNFDLDNKIRINRKNLTMKSLTQFNGYSRSRIRRINSIEENIIQLFRQNRQKLRLYLKSEEKNIEQMISSMNIQNPQIFSILQDGVYVLIQGCIKMISFDEQKVISKSTMKQIINNLFRKIKINKQPSSCTKGSNGFYNNKNAVKDNISMMKENSSRQINKDGINNNKDNSSKDNINKQNNSNKQSNQYIKRTALNQKSQQYFTIGTFIYDQFRQIYLLTVQIASFEQPFTVFQCINENCCSFSNDTILYRLDEQQLKMFKYQQNKQSVKKILKYNKQYFKTNSMLYNTIEYKKYYFRNELQVDNIAIIKRGTVKVYQKKQIKHKKQKGINKQKIINKQTIINKQNKQRMQIQQKYYNQNKLNNERNIICQLCEYSILVKGFVYQVSSHQVDIIFISNHQTFQFIQNPDWVHRFYINNQTQKKERNVLKKKSIHTNIRKHFHKFSYNQSSLSAIYTPTQLSFNQRSSNYHQDQQNIHHFKQNSSNNKNQQLTHNKYLSQLFNIQTFNKPQKSNKNQVFNQNNIVKEVTNKKTKKMDVLRMLSPYVLICQKIGMKQVQKTRNILNERSLNTSPLQMSSPLKLNKMSKNHLKRYQIQSSLQQLNKSKSLFKNQKQNSYKFQEKHKQKQYNNYKMFNKFEKYIKQRDLIQYKEKIRQNNNKHKTFYSRKDIKSHRKSLSQLTPLTSSNFHLTLHKNLSNKHHINLKSDFKSINLSHKYRQVSNYFPHQSIEKLNLLQ